MSDDSMPPDPFGAPEELITMMRGMYNLHSAAQASGFPEHIATQFIIGVFCSLMQGAQNAASPETEETQ